VVASDERRIRKESVPPVNPKAEPAPHSISFYMILGVALFAFIWIFSLLSPILLSFLLVLLISLAVNPIIFRMRALTGGRKISTGLVVAGLAVMLALGQGGMVPVWVLLAYAAVQVLENNMITPFIMSRGMQLHPLAVIFSMLLCVSAFGVLGVLIAAPLVAIVRIVHDELYRKRFLPHVTDANLDRLAGIALHEIRPDER